MYAYCRDKMLIAKMKRGRLFIDHAVMVQKNRGFRAAMPVRNNDLKFIQADERSYAKPFLP